MTTQDVLLAAPAPTRASERRRAVRHSRLVRVLRLALPAVGGTLVLGLVVVAALPKFLPFSALAGLSLTADGLVMNEPRLAGHLGEGRRYEVFASRAVQSLVNPSRLSLEGLAASLDLGSDQVSIHGTLARYDTDTEVLTLSDGVSIASTDGNDAFLASATVNLREGTVTSDDGVTVNSPKGRIEAGGLAVADGGDTIRFTDGVTILINP